MLSVAPAPIAILGAGGGTAKPLIAALQRRGAHVRAVVRRPEQAGGFADARVADLADRDALARAIEGVGVVHLIPPVFNDREPLFAANLIAAAEEVGVKRVVYHSVLHAPTPAMPHHRRKSEVELMLRESPLAWTILQPAMYMQTGFTFLNRATGAYTVPFDPDAPFTPIDVIDLAEAAAAVLTGEGHDYATYELAGTERITPGGMAVAIGEATGEMVQLSEVHPETFAAARAAGRGFDERQCSELLAMYRHYDGHGLLGNGNVLTMLLGREPACFTDVASRDLARHSGT